MSERKIKTQLSCPVRSNSACGILPLFFQFPNGACQKHPPLQVLYIFVCKEFHMWLLGPHSAHVPILIALLPQPSFLCHLFKCPSSSCPLLVSFFLFTLTEQFYWLHGFSPDLLLFSNLRDTTACWTSPECPSGAPVSTEPKPNSYLSFKLPLLHCFHISTSSGTYPRNQWTILDSSLFTTAHEVQSSLSL